MAMLTLWHVNEHLVISILIRLLLWPRCWAAAIQGPARTHALLLAAWPPAMMAIDASWRMDTQMKYCERFLSCCQLKIVKLGGSLLCKHLWPVIQAALIFMSMNIRGFGAEWIYPSAHGTVCVHCASAISDRSSQWEFAVIQYAFSFFF